MNDTDMMREWAERKDAEERAEMWFKIAIYGWALAIGFCAILVVIVFNKP